MKKGVSPVIAAVILLTLTVLLGFIIFNSSLNFITELSPPTYCPNVIFEMQIIGDILEVDNQGNEDIIGFIINIDDKQGSIDTEEVISAVARGQSIQKNIDFAAKLNQDYDITAQPKIISSGKFVTCDNQEPVSFTPTQQLAQD